MSRVPENAGGTPRRLSKRDVERLVESYDDDPVSALSAALDVVGAPDHICAAVSTMATAERDALLKDLIEWRGLEPPGELGINR